MSKKKRTKVVKNNGKVKAYGGTILYDEKKVKPEKSELLEVSVPQEAMVALTSYQIDKLEGIINSCEKKLTSLNASIKKEKKRARMGEMKENLFKKTRAFQPAFFGSIGFVAGSLLTLWAVFRFFGTITTAIGTAWSFFAYLTIGALLGTGIYKLTQLINGCFIAPHFKKSSKERADKIEALEEKSECISEKLARAQEELDIRKAELLLRKRGYSITVGV